MSSLSRLAYWEGMILLVGFAGITAWKLFSGEISLENLLRGDGKDSSGHSISFVSPGRVQLLMTTIISGLYYLLQVMHDPTVFPRIPTAWLVGLGGSHAIYLAGKAQSLLRIIGTNTARH